MCRSGLEVKWGRSGGNPDVPYARERDATLPDDIAVADSVDDVGRREAQRHVVGDSTDPRRRGRRVDHPTAQSNLAPRRVDDFQITLQSDQDEVDDGT